MGVDWFRNKSFDGSEKDASDAEGTAIISEESNPVEKPWKSDLKASKR